MTNTQPKATGEDLEAQGTVATKHFPSRMYAVYVHVSCIQHSQHVHGRQPYLHGSDGRGNIEEMMHRKIRLYLGKIQLYLHRESASRVTGESARPPRKRIHFGLSTGPLLLALTLSLALGLPGTDARRCEHRLLCNL